MPRSSSTRHGRGVRAVRRPPPHPSARRPASSGSRAPACDRCYRSREMGAWGTGSFDNDSALDFVGDVVEGGDWQAVMELALAPVEPGEPIRDEVAAIAAAEIVAAARGHAAPEL